MKRLLTGVAVAALMAAGLPALAQSDNSDQMKKPAQSTSRSGASAQNTKQATPSDAAAQSGASTPSSSDNASMPSSSAKKHARKHQSANARGGRSPEDNMAEELNRQELQRLSGGNQGSNQMPSGQSGTSSQSGATGQGGMSSTGGAQQHQ